MLTSLKPKKLVFSWVRKKLLYKLKSLGYILQVWHIAILHLYAERGLGGKEPHLFHPIYTTLCMEIAFPLF